jgi:hypothetical protein
VKSDCWKNLELTRGVAAEEPIPIHRDFFDEHDRFTVMRDWKMTPLEALQKLAEMKKKIT